MQSIVQKITGAWDRSWGEWNQRKRERIKGHERNFGDDAYVSSFMMMTSCVDVYIKLIKFYILSIYCSLNVS